MSDRFPPGPDTVAAFPVRVTLEDRLAIQNRCLRSPAMRAGQLRWEALAVLLSPVYVMICGLAGVTIS